MKSPWFFVSRFLRRMIESFTSSMYLFCFPLRILIFRLPEVFFLKRLLTSANRRIQCLTHLLIQYFLLSSGLEELDFLNRAIEHESFEDDPLPVYQVHEESQSASLRNLRVSSPDAWWWPHVRRLLHRHASTLEEVRCEFPDPNNDTPSRLRIIFQNSKNCKLEIHLKKWKKKKIDSVYRNLEHTSSSIPVKEAIFLARGLSYRKRIKNWVPLNFELFTPTRDLITIMYRTCSHNNQRFRFEAYAHNSKQLMAPRRSGNCVITDRAFLPKKKWLHWGLRSNLFAECQVSQEKSFMMPFYLRVAPKSLLV